MPDAVLWILNTGARWDMLPPSHPNYKTVHRRFSTGGRQEVLREVLTHHQGLPLSASTHTANHHEAKLWQRSFDCYLLEAERESLLGDRAHDSDPRDEELAQAGVK